MPVLVIIHFIVQILVRNPEQVSIKNSDDPCPRDWIGFGSKCFYFSEDTSNWTFSQNFCKELKAQVAQFDNMEELVRKDQELVCLFVVCFAEYVVL